jgi:hypothetical protein
MPPVAGARPRAEPSRASRVDCEDPGGCGGGRGEETVNIFYIIGVVVVVLIVLGFLGLR